MSVDVQIEGAEQLAQVAKRLKQAGRADLRKDMFSEIRALSKPMLIEAKAAALAIPASGSKTSGLRARIAKTTKLQMLMGKNRSGVRIRVDSEKMGDQRTLPKAFNRGTVRHPVFGTDRWVTQDTRSAGWFSNVPKRHVRAVRAGVLAVMRRTVEKIAG